MANKFEKLVAFHGGLNDNSDPKDIAEDELSSATDCSVSRVGRIGIIGGADTELTNLDGASVNPVKDHGMFYFSSDRDKDGKQKSEDWLALYDSGDGKVQYYYRDKQGSSPDISSSIEDSFVESGKAATGKPSFFIADGILRYSNGDFTASTNNRVHQYVDNGLFDKTTVSAHLSTTATLSTTSPIITSLASTTDLKVGDIASGTGIPPNTKVLEIQSNQALLSNVPTVGNSGVSVAFKNPSTVVRQGWVNSDQELKSFDDIFALAGTGSLKMDKSDTAGPDATAISTALGTVVLSYWTSDEGNWNGSFQFAASPIYHQGGVGPISNFDDTINFHENKVSFQLHIGLTNTIVATTHPFGDDRITGIRVFFRSHGADKWHKLKDFDLLKGGKFNWQEYNTGTHTAYGIFSGSIGSITIADTPGADAGVKESYKQTTATFVVTNSANGFSGRYGFVRLWGPYNEPIWKNLDDSGDPISLESDTHVLNITTPGEGEREFQAELLDETFQVVAQSTKQKITIADSGDVPPPTYTDDAGSS